MRALLTLAAGLAVVMHSRAPWTERGSVPVPWTELVPDVVSCAVPMPVVRPESLTAAVRVRHDMEAGAEDQLQDPAREARAKHEQTVAAYAAAEIALLRTLREITKSGPVSAEHQAQLEALARARDIALRRARESSLLTGLPLPSRAQALAQATPPAPTTSAGGEAGTRLFARAEDLVQAARAADVRRLVKSVALGRRF